MKNSKVSRDGRSSPNEERDTLMCHMTVRTSWDSVPPGVFPGPHRDPISKRQWSVLTLYHHFPLFNTFLFFPIPFKRIRGYQDTQQYGGHAEIIHLKLSCDFTRTALQVCQPATHPPSQELQDESFSKSQRNKWKKVESKRMNSNKRKYVCIYLYIHIMWTVKSRGKTPTSIG